MHRLSFPTVSILSAMIAPAVLSALGCQTPPPAATNLPAIEGIELPLVFAKMLDLPAFRANRTVEYEAAKLESPDQTIARQIDRLNQRTVTTAWSPDGLLGWIAHTPNGRQLAYANRVQIERSSTDVEWTIFGGPAASAIPGLFASAESKLWVDPEWLFKVFEQIQPRIRHREHIVQEGRPVTRLTATLSVSQAKTLLRSGAVARASVGWNEHIDTEMCGTFDVRFDLDIATRNLRRIEARIAVVDLELEIGNASFFVTLPHDAILTPDEPPGPEVTAEFQDGFPVDPARNAHRFAYIWTFSHHGEPPPFRLNAQAKTLLGL